MSKIREENKLLRQENAKLCNENAHLLGDLDDVCAENQSLREELYALRDQLQVVSSNVDGVSYWTSSSSDTSTKRLDDLEKERQMRDAESGIASSNSAPSPPKEGSLVAAEPSPSLPKGDGPSASGLPPPPASYLTPPPWYGGVPPPPGWAGPPPPGMPTPWGWGGPPPPGGGEYSAYGMPSPWSGGSFEKAEAELEDPELAAAKAKVALAVANAETALAALAEAVMKEAELDKAGLAAAKAKAAAEAKNTAEAEDAETEEYEQAVEEARARMQPSGSTWLKYGGAELEPLWQCTKVLDVRWLLRLALGEVMAERKGVVPAWQQVPEEALVSLDDLRASRWDMGLPIGILSYGWASKRHPDPTGEQLQALVPLLRAVVKECDRHAEGDYNAAPTWGIVWDFCSLPQRGYTTSWSDEVDDRTSEQLAYFRRGLHHINVWYGAAYTHVLVLDTPLPTSAENTTEYERRGWCIFESWLSRLVKHDHCYLQLSKSSIKSSKQYVDWHTIRAQCKANRPAPMAPDSFECFMLLGVEKERVKPGSGITFTSGKDLINVIIPQYRRSFLRLMCRAETLVYAHLGWSKDDVATLCAALRYAKRVGGSLRIKTINLRNNFIDEEGQRALSELQHFLGASGIDVDVWYGANALPVQLTRSLSGGETTDKRVGRA